MIELLLTQAKAATAHMLQATDQQMVRALLHVADAIEQNTAMLLEENAKDLTRMDRQNPMYDRLQLSGPRLQAIAADMRNVAALPSPVGQVLRSYTHPNGLLINKVSIPFGVVGIVYEARPNVTFDVFALAMRSHNVCLLKGGSDAYDTNQAAVSLIQRVLSEEDLNPHCVQLLPPGHEATTEMLHARGMVDVIIPRGGRGLIDHVRQNATVPVIETGAGICHTYFDHSGDTSKGAVIINNAKTRRISVCNAMDCLLIHRSRLNSLPELCQKLTEHQVQLYADPEAFNALQGHYPDNLLHPAVPSDFQTEFLDYKMAIKTVGNANEAIAHINTIHTGHSECIVTEDQTVAQCFTTMVDAACVYVNAPTSFSDGAQFGLGAEVGISTQKLHARGPMGPEALTTYKWIIQGNAQTRE